MDINKIKLNIANDGRYLANINSISYLISIDVYTILYELKNKKNSKEIYEVLKNKGKNYTVKEITEVIENTLPKLFNDSIKIENPVKKIFILCNSKVFKKYNKYTDWCFKYKTFYILILLLLLFSVIFIFKNKLLFNDIFQLKKEWIITFIFTFLIMFIHEVGHTLAAIKFELEPPKIGFGIYFIYPAMFTDLTEAWRLGNKERIIINFSGMYFQLFLNIFLIFLFYIDLFNNFYIFSFIFTNLMIIFFNLNPLFKFDGYWIFSDYYNLPNLRSRGTNYIVNLFKKKKYEEEKIVKIYSFTYVFFMIFVWIFLIINFYNSIKTLLNNNIKFEDKYKSIFIIFIVFFVLFNLIKPLIKKYVKKIF
jgi:putative peptide zinc metalloprotease protein